MGTLKILKTQITEDGVFKAGDIVVVAAGALETRLKQGGGAIEISDVGGIPVVPPSAIAAKQAVILSEPGGATVGATTIRPSSLTDMQAAQTKAGPGWQGGGPRMVWFPFTEGQGSIATSQPNAIVATVSGAGTPWQPNPGFNFSGTNYLEVATTEPQASLRSIMSLKSLTADEMIVAFGVLGHPTSMAQTGAIFYWGRSGGSNQGWGMRLSTALNPSFHHRAFGTSTSDTPVLELSNWNTNNNTRTAFCFTISRHSSSILEIGSAVRFLGAPGSYNQTNRTATITPLARPSGATEPCDYQADKSLAIGCAPGNDSTPSDIMPAGVSLLNLGFLRTKRDYSRRVAIVRDLSADVFSFPNSAAV